MTRIYPCALLNTMDTRFSVIAGTLLVGLSLFVTSLISQNLGSSTVNQTQAANTQCRLKTSCDSCTSEECRTANNCSFYSSLTVWCEYFDEAGALQKAGAPASMLPTPPPGAGGCLIRNRCNSLRTEILYTSSYGSLQQWCQGYCNGTATPPTATPTTVPGENPPPPVQSTPAANCPVRVDGGLRCEPNNDCCKDGFFCKAGDPSVCTSLTVITPTPGPRCLPLGIRRGTVNGCNNPGFPNGNPCCAPNKCRVVGITNPGEDFETIDISCDGPTATPTPTPTIAAGACGDGCSPSSPCRSGQGTCKNTDNPGQPIDAEFCARNPGKCKCVRNEACTPGSPDECWCLNINSCPGIGGNERKLCGKVCDDEGCFSFPVCPDGLKCALYPGETFGRCSNQFCPNPTATPTPPYLLRNPGESARTIQLRRDQAIQNLLREYPGLDQNDINQFPYSARVDFGLN